MPEIEAVTEADEASPAFTPFAQSIGLVVAIVLCFAAAGLGGLDTTPQIPNWYAALAKPTCTPPDWIFGPVAFAPAPRQPPGTRCLGPTF